MIKVIPTLAAALLALAGATAHGGNVTKPTPPSVVEVNGAHVDISAQWNESRDGVGQYQAPAGYLIRSAMPVVQSESRSSYQVKISADKREATLSAHCRGSGEFWNKSHGWFQGNLHIVLEPQS
jgi:hypothetical protein